VFWVGRCEFRQLCGAKDAAVADDPSDNQVTDIRQRARETTQGRGVLVAAMYERCDAADYFV